MIKKTLQIEIKDKLYQIKISRIMSMDNLQWNWEELKRRITGGHY